MSESKVPFQFSRKRAVTLPLFKWVNGTERYYRFDAAMYIGKPIKEKEGATKKEPATLANVTDLETGEEGQIILGAVLRGIFHDEYPEDGYVGKCFAITQTRPTGKDYNHYAVIEIEPNETPNAVADTGKKK